MPIYLLTAKDKRRLDLAARLGGERLGAAALGAERIIVRATNPTAARREAERRLRLEDGGRPGPGGRPAVAPISMSPWRNPAITDCVAIELEGDTEVLAIQRPG